MSITVTLAGVDHTSDISFSAFKVQQNIGAPRDTATLIYNKYGSKSYVPAVRDTVLIQDGSTKILGGRIASVELTNLNDASGATYKLDCTDYSIDLDSELVTGEYESMSVEAIIADFAANFATGFTTTNVSCGFVVDKIVFNQIPISQAIKKLADLVKYEWYVDPDKDIHFFPKYTELSAFDLTDTSGNYINSTLRTVADGSQIANKVKVRGGKYLSENTYTDTITVKGNDTKSFKLPYQFKDLSVTVNSVPKTVGVDFVDDFTTDDVLYNFQQWTMRFENPLSDGDLVEYVGTPYIPVQAVAEDAVSIATYGTQEKLVEDAAITDINIARQRAIAELNAHKDPVYLADFETVTAGLRVGQTININSSRRSLNMDFIISEVTFTPRTPTTFSYRIKAVTARTYTFLEVLQSLLLPEQRAIDPNEISEIIKTDFVTITVTENIQKDVLGANVEPTWVLGTYTPSGISDPKRNICLDRRSARLG